jgi:hypothetical protein
LDKIPPSPYVLMLSQRGRRRRARRRGDAGVHVEDALNFADEE